MREPRRTGREPLPPTDIAVDEPSFRSIFEQSPVSTQIFSPDGRTLQVNRAWERLWGVTLDQIWGYNILKDQQLVAKGIMAYIQRGFAGYATEIPAIKYEPSATIPDISPVPYRWVEAFIYPVKDEFGNVREVVLTHRDITEQKRAEEALRESEERLRAILDHSSAVVYLKDPAGRYILVNRRYEALFGVSRDQAAGKTDHDIFPKEMAEAFRLNDRKVLEAGTALEFEEVAPQEDGPRTYISIKFPIYDASGALYGVCGISTDITERKRAEEERAQLLEREHAARAEAEAAVKARDEFLSIASHELRTPLAGLKGRVQLIQRQLAREAPDLGRLRHSAASLDASADHLARLVEDLLDVSRLHTGRLRLRPTELDLAALSSELAERAQQAAPAHRVKLEVACPDGGCALYADADRIRQVVSNLLENAVKYSPDGGEVRVRLVRDGGGLLLRVEDQGIGLPPGSEESIFEPFGRASNATERHLPGMGLGLYVSRQIAHAHGGWLRAESAGEGRGTAFSLWLPIQSSWRR